jgi:hypothetical protein
MAPKLNEWVTVNRKGQGYYTKTDLQNAIKKEYLI